MFNCERCGSSYNPMRAATLVACPRCQGRDGVVAPLSFSLFTGDSAAEGTGAVSAGVQELVESPAADNRLGSLGDHV